MLHNIRRIFALLFWTLITLLFLDFTGTLHSYFGWMTRIQFLPALLALNIGIVVALIALTLLLGRVYCSVICPLGVFQDIISWIVDKRKKNRFQYSPEVKWLRYGTLGLFILTMVTGFNSIAILIAPYSIYGRIASSFFAPLYQWVNNGLAYLAERADSYIFYETSTWLRSLPTMIIAGITLVIIIVLAWRSGRTYCNTICPVGTILGFLSQYSFLKLQIDTSKCNSCGLCARNCRASCINAKEHTIDNNRCVVCMDCIDKCHKKAICYMHRKKNFAMEAPAFVNTTTRRAFFSSSVALLTTAILHAQEKKVDGGLADIKNKKIPERATPILPPGSRSAHYFAQHCTACQLCVSVCSNNVLRPSSDLNYFMQPKMSYERGFCRPECMKCAEVCPTGVLRLTDLAEKSSTQLGHAVWVRENCICLTDKVKCDNCARHCLNGAIQMVPSNPQDKRSIKIPIINTERCIGCGACENLCPARPFSAIYVEGHEVQRII